VLVYRAGQKVFNQELGVGKNLLHQVSGLGGAGEPLTRRRRLHNGKYEPGSHTPHRALKRGPCAAVHVLLMSELMITLLHVRMTD
jgi:hypothetical protein